METAGELTGDDTAAAVTGAAANQLRLMMTLLLKNVWLCLLEMQLEL